jgi:hypothetical protein
VLQCTVSFPFIFPSDEKWSSLKWLSATSEIRRASVAIPSIPFCGEIRYIETLPDVAAGAETARERNRCLILQLLVVAPAA